MYPQIKPEKSIASDARKVSIPNLTMFGPGLWGNSRATAEEFISDLVVDRYFPGQHQAREQNREDNQDDE
jgi:hypothetical protein